MFTFDSIQISRIGDSNEYRVTVDGTVYVATLRREDEPDKQEAPQRASESPASDPPSRTNHKYPYPATITVSAMVRAGLMEADISRMIRVAQRTGRVTDKTPAVLIGGRVYVPFVPLCEELGIDPAEAAERLPKRAK